MIIFRNITSKLLMSALSVMLIAPLSLNAQSIKELEKEKKKALEELAVTNKLLNETKGNKRETENKISLLKRSINQSSEYINILNGELRILNHDIDSISNEYNTKSDQLQQLKSGYANTTRILHAQRRSFSPLLFIISAKNFNQAFRRYQYLQDIAQQHKNQAREIEQITTQLQEHQTLLTENKIQKETVMSTKELEQQRLQNQKNQKDKELAKLRTREKSLKEKQKKQQQQANKLNKRIEELIAAEIKKNQNKSNSSNDPYKLTKEEKLIAGNFEANKGKLPHPIAKGFISGHFGVQPHPILDKVTINNKGIYLQTTPGASARAIFEGEVTQIFSIPGSNTSVIIKHGNYRTVYSNLVSVSVKVGDKVTTKQNIGKIYSDPENDNKTELYLMLYKNTEIQNPESWLAK